MKRITWISTAFAMIALAVPAFAGHDGAKKGEKCTYDTQTCLNHFAAMRGNGWVGLELDKSEAGAVWVKGVVKDTPAEKAGIQVGDVLVARNGVKFSDHEAMKGDKSSRKAGDKVTFTVLRKDVEKTFTLTMAPMPDEVFARMVGDHMISDHMVAATAENAVPAEKAGDAASASAKSATTDK